MSITCSNLVFFKKMIVLGIAWVVQREFHWEYEPLAQYLWIYMWCVHVHMHSHTHIHTWGSIKWTKKLLGNLKIMSALSTLGLK